jgi:RHS repeat-associated protein
VPNVFIDARLRTSPKSTRSVSLGVRRRFRALVVVAAILASILAPLLPLAGVSAAVSNRVRASLAAQAREATLAQLAKDPVFQIPQVHGGASYSAPIARATHAMRFLPMDPPPPATYSSTVLADSPVAYWHLDDTTGAVMADAQNNDAGTYQGGFTLSQPALIAPASGNSVSFDGSTGYATAPTLTALQGANTRSIEIWFQTTYNGGEPLFDSGAPGGSNYQMFNLQTTGPNMVGGNPPNPNTSGLLFMTWGQGFYLPGLFLADGKRHHLVVELSGNNLWIYVDNTLPKGFLANPGWDTRYALAQPFNLPNALNTTGNPILFGTTRYGAGGINYFQGRFDEAAVYSTALTATQVQNHWQAGNGLPWSPRTVTATPGQNQVALSWQVPTFNATGITGYVVTPHVGSTLRTPITFNSTATSETISNLSGGTAYTFTVNGVNSLGTGISSDPSSSATPTGSALPIYEDTALADSPAGFWPLGETSGNIATDLTGNANGQYFDSYVQGDAGPVINVPSKATNLSGSNAYVGLNHAASLEPASLTVELWIKPAAAIGGNSQNIIIGPQPGNNENTTYGYLLQVNANTGTATFYGGGSADSLAALPVGVWTYVVGTSDATSTHIYINGKQKGGGSSPPINYGGAPNFDALISRFGYPGDIADLAIYSTALTPTQIATHYAAAGYTPGPVTNLFAKASTNSASLSWTPPVYTGTSAISSYTITPVVDGTATTAITVSGPNAGANIPNLAGGASYTFGVQASNASGPGVAVTSGAATINSPSVGPGGFGTYLHLEAGPFNGQAFANYGFVSRNNAPALATWTLEARLWGIQSTSTTGSHMSLGYLGGTTGNPSDQNLVAGLYFDTTATRASFVWPGGSCQLATDAYGIPTAFDSATTTAAHVALTYDGTTVRGFINGAIAIGPGPDNIPCSQAAATAALPAGPFGFMDNDGLTRGSFDEIRVSNTAEWTSNFTVPNTQWPSNDGHTMLLWHFNDYGITKLPVVDIPSNVPGYPVNIIPSTYRDASGNLNHANTVWHSGSSSVNTDLFERAYSLGQGVTADELTGGASPWLCPCTINSTAAPINDATGEFWHTFTDFNIAGRMPLDFTRTYSSLRSAVQNPIDPIGFGWNDNYSEYLSFDGPGNATVHAGNGSAVVFTFSTPSTYTAPPSEHVTLIQNGDLSFTLTDKALNQTVFNKAVGSTSTLQKVVDRHLGAAYTTTVSHNADGTLQKVTDPAGRTLTFGYSIVGLNRLITITDTATPARKVTLQVGNDSSQLATYQDLTQVTDVAGGLTKFTYDASHYLQTMTDPNGGITTNTYDPGSHQITSQQDPISTHPPTTFSYSGGITTVTDPKGNVTQEEYINGMLISRTLGFGTAQQATWTYAYDVSALGATAVIGPSGESSTSVRDSNGNVLSSTDGLGRATSYTYNSFSEPLTIADPSLVTTTNIYNSAGDLTSTSRPLVGTSQTATTTYTYGDSAHPGDVTKMTDPDLNVFNYTYDPANGNRVSSTDPLSNKTTFAFDTIGRMTSMVTPKGNVTGGHPLQFTWSYTYDAFGNRLTVTDPLSHKTTYHYDPNQNQDKLTDALGNVTTNVYDLDNELIQVKRADSPQTSLITDYNPDGSVLDQKDGKGNAILSYGYDSLARVTTVTDALGNVTGYSHDGNGNQLTKQDPGGNCAAVPLVNCISYTNDAGNQLTAISYSDGVTPNVSNIMYDADGQRTALTDGTGTSVWGWDSLHRMVSYSNGNGAQVKWIYNLRNLPITITYPGPLNVIEGYDAAGRWTSVQDWNNNKTTLGYDANSNLTTETFPTSSGVIDTNTFDNADNLMKISDKKGSATLFSATYTRDSANQLKSDTSAISGQSSYRYTSLNQICYAGSGTNNACASPPSGSLAYKYDAADNPVQTGATQQAFNNADELCWTAATSSACSTPPSGATTYQYDTRGNRTTVTPSAGQAQTLGYDQAGRLISYAAASTTSYGYNAGGLRMSKKVGSITTQFVWDMAGGLPVPLMDGTTAYVYGPGGLPLEQINGSTTYYFHHDQLGSTRLLTDGTGTSKATYGFDSYGNLSTSTGSITNPVRFAGQYFDAESGFYNLRARFYDPSSAQFISRDPVVEQTREPYVYVAGSPLNRVDPSGLLDLRAGWNALVGGMTDYKAWKSSLQDFSTTSHSIAAACGMAAFIPGTQPFTVPCAATFAVLGTVADVALVSHGDMDRSALAWDALSIAGGVGGWYAVTRAASCGSRWSALLRNGGNAGTAWKAMMGAKRFAENWESVTIVAVSADTAASVKRVVDNLMS